MDEYAEGDEEHTAELVMPFVVCASQGGLYDDDAFAAGFAIGDLMACLGDPRINAYGVVMRTALVPQCDLIGMMHGYEVESATWDADEGWSNVVFSRKGVAETDG